MRVSKHVVRGLLAVACVGIGASSAFGQVPAGRFDGEEIRLSGLGVLRVTPRGVIDELPGIPRACNAVASHTDANFEGGSFVVQAGFAQGEMFAATYTVPAGEWPIKHNMTEVIVATSSTVVPTVTQWSLLFYEGEPGTGTLVATYSSDGDLLPHIQIPAGTAGVNLQFLIDPNDPEQIVLNNNGSNKFTVAFRIDRHNTPPSNPCLNSPDPRRNAFPVTDVSGLSQGSATWLFGLNCGSFGCPPNGGWVRFSQLVTACRPTGDWVSRTTWSSVNCQPGVGACCLPSGACEIRTVNDCQAAGGTFAGDGTSCAGRNCPAANGACCFQSGFCLQLTEANCVGAGGSWAGANTACGNGNTCPTGACCLPNGTCITGTTLATCTEQGGTFRGVGTSCAGANCPQPQGACCFNTGFCIQLTQAECAGAGGSWSGAQTTCADSNGNGQADICESPCAADFNGDGFLDFFDFDEFVVCFEGGSCPPGKSADFNQDGFADFFDYDEFIGAFETGC
jgi:hypothetical protein